MFLKKSDEKSYLLQEVLDDSNRLLPMFVTMIDDFKTSSNRTSVLGHIINSHLIKKRNVTVLLLGTHEEQFLRKSYLQLNSNVRIVQDSESFLKDNESNKNLFKNLHLLSKESSSNVLIIDSINPIYLTLNSQNDNQIKNSINTICKNLFDLRSYYQFVIVTYHSDAFFQSDDCMNYNETGLDHISNVFMDFRLESTNTESIAKCSIKNSMHCLIKLKFKHPRTHFKVRTQHEHFNIFELAPNMYSIKFISLLNENSSNDETVKKTLVNSSFRLTLTEDEQKAREKLILPYIKKNSQSKSGCVVSNEQHPEIAYVYDKYDDFDDEDALDDDLDF